MEQGQEISIRDLHLGQHLNCINSMSSRAYVEGDIAVVTYISSSNRSLYIVKKHFYESNKDNDAVIREAGFMIEHSALNRHFTASLTDGDLFLQSLYTDSQTYSEVTSAQDDLDDEEMWEPDHEEEEPEEEEAQPPRVQLIRRADTPDIDTDMRVSAPVYISTEMDANHIFGMPEITQPTPPVQVQVTGNTIHPIGMGNPSLTSFAEMPENAPVTAVPSPPAVPVEIAHLTIITEGITNQIHPGNFLQLLNEGLTSDYGGAVFIVKSAEHGLYILRPVAQTTEEFDMSNYQESGSEVYFGANDLHGEFVFLAR